MSAGAFRSVINRYFDVDAEAEGLLVAWLSDLTAEEMIRACILHAVADPLIEVEAVGFKLAAGEYRENYASTITVLRPTPVVRCTYWPLRLRENVQP